jgi:hypothetical protein
MRRWLRRGALALAALLVVLAVPVAWIEGRCTAPRDPGGGRAAPLVDEPGYARRQSDSYLTFPEWDIVYAYDDLAAVLARGDESDFAYGRQIAGFWRSFCALNRVVTARDPTGLDTKVSLYTIGWSFTVELGIKGAYEQTVGRVFEWVRGPVKTAEDAFVHGDLAAYAAFLRQTPFYAYPFGARLRDFWRETPLAGAPIRSWPRKVERRLEFTLEYGVKAIYGAIIGYASNTAFGAADLQIRSVVVGLTAGDAAADPRLTVERDLGNGRALVRTPRYQAFTEVLIGLARRGRDVAEIAGNDRILVTVLAHEGALPPLDGARPLFEQAIQSEPRRRRVGLDVRVAELAATIRALEGAGATVEHVFDY